MRGKNQGFLGLAVPNTQFCVHTAADLPFVFGAEVGQTDIRFDIARVLSVADTEASCGMTACVRRWPTIAQVSMTRATLM